MRKLLLFVGVCWAVVAWSLWPITPHRGYISALACAIWLAPSYLLLSVVRGRAIPMRVFVGSALLILILAGSRVIPGQYDMIWIYLSGPPLMGFATALWRWLGRKRFKGWKEDWRSNL